MHEDRLAPVVTGSEVKDGAGELDALGASHGLTQRGR
jgi:hypothetical protein